jgi:hypothetical protein
MGPLLIAIAVVLCSAYLLWQAWSGDVVEDVREVKPAKR